MPTFDPQHDWNATRRDQELVPSKETWLN